MAAPRAPITLLTDFGTRDGYVAAMKGVILGIAPGATLVDITHEVSPHDVAEAASLLASVWRFFPPGTVHLAVVDPGVGSARRAIAVAAGGHLFVAPDNGLLGMALHGVEDRRIVAIENRRLFRPTVSATFHGRDLFAPVAAHLALGTPLEEAGPEVPDLFLLPETAPVALSPGVWEGRVVAVDRFGNLVTNIPGELARQGRVRVSLAGVEIEGLREYYEQAPPGGLLALVGSSGFLEVARNLGSAAQALGAGRGTPVRVAIEA